MKEWLLKLIEEKGVTSIEYAIIASLIAMVIALAIAEIGQKVGGTFIAVGGSFPK